MSPRPLALALALALAPGLLACGGTEDDDAQPEYDFTLTAPVATAELLPGDAIPITWTMTGATTAHLTVDLVSLGDDGTFAILDQDIAEGAGGGDWAGTDLDGALVPPDVYDLVATVLVGDTPAGSALRNVSVHGVYFTSPATGVDLTVTGTEITDTGQHDLTYVTVSQRVIELVTSLDPDPAVAGDELIIDERSIPGEFVPFVRTVHFEGTTLEGAAIPEGDYTLTLDALDADDPELAYRRTGGRLLWRPAL